MKRHVYRERDYAFAQMVLTLRTAISLSQVGLAERLGSSRRAVAEWEGGLSYPKTERLTITGIRGLSEAQKASLRALGAFEGTSPDE